MSWKKILLDHAHLEPFFAKGASRTFMDMVYALIQEQTAHWPALNKARERLAESITRNIFLSSLEVTLQCNPGRLASTRSAVDRESVRSRPCFLCLNHLPPEQRALLYQEEWLVLNNPAPLFPEHLVISHIDHCPQRIEAALRVMLDLVKDMNFSFTAFYNGPACGASAPDHLHFQMSPNGEIPLLAQIDTSSRTDARTLPCKVLERNEQGLCFTGYLDNRSLFVCRTKSPDFLLDRMRRALALLPSAPEHPDEPMVNAIISGAGGVFQGIIFPRRAHRPACYYTSEPERMLISPGAVDVGGLIILPRREDFGKIDRDMILEIFYEVCQGPEVLEKLQAISLTNWQMVRVFR